MTMHYIPGNAINDDGTLGRHQQLIVVDGCDPETGAPMTWALEAQTKTVSAPIVRCAAWAFHADSAADCERALGKPVRA